MNRLDWRNPISRGLKFFASMHEGIPYDYVKRRPGIPNASYRGPRPSPGGPLCWSGLMTDGPETSVLFDKDDSMLVGKNQMTAMVLTKHSGAEFTNSNRPLGYAGTGDDPFYIQSSSAGLNFDFRLWTTGVVSNSSQILVANTDLKWTDWLVWGGTYDGSEVTARAMHYKDPTPVSQTDPIIGDNGTNSNNVPRFGFGYNGGTGAWDGWLAFGAIWDRALTDEEWASMVADPWQLFQRKRLPVVRPVPAAAAAYDPRFIDSATAYVASGTSITITHGMDIKAGEVLVAFVTHSQSGAFTSVGGVFTEDFQEESPVTATTQYGIFSRVATSGEAASWTFTSAGTAGRFSVHVLRFKDIDTSGSIWDVAPGTGTRATEDAVTSLTTPKSLTTTNSVTVGIGFIYQDIETAAFSGFTVGSNPVYGGANTPNQWEVTETFTSSGAQTAFDATSDLADDITVHYVALKGLVEAGGAVTITDVNTTESWNDGDSNLIITGSGFV